MVRRNIPEGERLRRQACKAPTRCRPAAHCLLPGLGTLDGKGWGTEIQGAGSNFKKCGHEGRKIEQR